MGLRKKKNQQNPILGAVVGLVGKLGSTAIGEGIKRTPYVRLIKVGGFLLISLIIILAVVFGKIDMETAKELKKLFD